MQIDGKVEDFLAHYGVKGMKWGVRKAEKGASRQTKREVRKDRKWAKDVHRSVQSGGMEFLVSARMNTPGGGIDQLNARHAGKNLLNDGPEKTAYFKDYEQTYERELGEAAKMYGKSPSGGYQAKVIPPRRVDGQLVQGEVHISPVEKVKHAEGEPIVEPIVIKFDVDTKGFVVKAEEPPEEVEQAGPVDDFLAHYGVKGMKWGTRKSRTSKKAKSVDVSDLSDKDLDAMIARLSKEQKLAQLAAGDQQRGQGLVRRTLAQTGSQALATVAVGLVTYGIGAKISGDTPSRKSIARNVLKYQ